MAELIVKVHTSNGKKIIALCDKSLLGKKIIEGKRQLDASSSFYKGEKKTEQEILDLLASECHINALGEEAIAFCKKHNLIQEENIITVAGVPHAEAALLF